MYSRWLLLPRLVIDNIDEFERVELSNDGVLSRFR